MTITLPPLPPEIAAQPLETLEGVVERITFADPESHYAVLRLKVKGRRHPTTVVRRPSDRAPRSSHTPTRSSRRLG